MARESLARLDGTIALPGLAADVEVLRDEWGVPHIYARNTDDLFFAQGSVMAQDRLWQMKLARRIGQGRVSELIGPAGFAHDQLIRLLKFRGPWDEAEWTNYHPDGRRIFAAYARGINAFIAHASANLPVEFKLSGIRRHNGRIAWGRTATGTDEAAIFVEELNPANPTEVRWNGKWEPGITVWVGCAGLGRSSRRWRTKSMRGRVGCSPQRSTYLGEATDAASDTTIESVSSRPAKSSRGLAGRQGQQGPRPEVPAKEKRRSRQARGTAHPGRLLEPVTLGAAGLVERVSTR